VTSCVGGVVVDSCTPATPSPEACDNLDNDCDGTIDNFDTTCGVEPCRAAGHCTAGVDTCVPGTPNPADVTCRTDHYLVAKAFMKSVPGGGSVLMWGFARDADGNLATDGGETPTVPGPMLAAPPGSSILTIHVRNDLPEPISLVIPGLPGALNPRWVDGTGAPVSDGSRPAGDYTSRARSFTSETAPGAIGHYSWTRLRPGTFLYQSGTVPAVQVQMGLYGALRMNSGAGVAYPGVGYDNEVVLVYHEIDPALHDAIQAGTYGTPAYPGTVDYRPQFFLINGEPYPAAAPILDHALRTNEDALVRLLNAGLQNRVPTFAGLTGDLVAEDGNPHTFAPEQYSALLSAGKTADMLVTPARSGSYPVYDHRLGLTDGPTGPGGMLTCLEVGDPAGTPHAGGNSYALLEDQSLTVPAPGVLGNDTDPEMTPLTASLVDGVPPGTAASFSLGSDGSVNYVPLANFNGSLSFTYRASDGVLNSNVATVVITVAPVNDTPVALPDAYSTDEGVALDVAAPGVLGNDSDVDGDPLTAIHVAGSGPAHGSLTLNPDGSFRYTPTTGYSGPDQFRYIASDGTADSAQATVSLTVVAAPNQPPIANDDAASTRRNTARVIPVLANDTDADGTLVPASVTIVTAPRYGTAVANADGTVTYTPRRNYTGSDAFAYTVRDNEGATSNAATVRVNVTR
jgi:hypothetical protein